jgi:purine-binding chemotaxis protein CheW
MAKEQDPNKRAQGGKYLTFKLADETFGIDVLKAQEIVRMLKVTRVPRAPEFVRGVVNLRGKVIPVLDLRRKFALPPVDDGERTCIVVTQITVRPGETMAMGAIVDEVSDVLDITDEQIEAVPAFGADVEAELILGVGKLEDQVVLLLDIDKLLSGVETVQMSKLTEVK